jgi:hypothetical protein
LRKSTPEIVGNRERRKWGIPEENRKRKKK